MKEQEAIKEYLLGALSDEAQRRGIEEKILLDDDFNEQLSIAEDELIDEYLAGNLDDSENKRFNRFFLITRERKQRLRLIRDLRKYAMKSETHIVKQSSPEKAGWFDWRGLFNSPSVRLAATAVLLIIVGVVVWRVAFYESDVDKGLAQLRVAYRGQRPTESRSTANLDYAPLTVTRGDAQVLGDEKARERAERYLFDATPPNSTDAKAHHALGLYYLAGKQFDKALSEFNIALQSAPDDAKLQSDIGALYLEKAILADEENKGDEFFKNVTLGLRYLNRALELNENLLEAIFNKALILQKMRSDAQAREAWQRYLEKDSVSPWADEARRNLELLEQQSTLPKEKPQVLQDFLDSYRKRDDMRAWQIASETKEFSTGLMVAQQLAKKFLEASGQSRPEEANEILSAFVYLGEIEKKNSKDPYFLDLANYYKNTLPQQREKIREAQGKFQEAQALLFEPKFERATEVFNEAKELLESVGDIWEAQIVEYLICYGLSQNDRIKESNERLSLLAKNCEQKNYKWMQSLAEGWIGGNYIFLGEASKSIAYNQKALKLAREISDVYNIQRSLIQTAEGYRSIDNSDKALSNIYDSLAFPVAYNAFPRQQWRNFYFTTQILYSFKFYEAASVYAREEIILGRDKLKDNWMNHSGLIHSGVIYDSLGKYPEAFEQIEASLKLAEDFSDEKLKPRLLVTSYVSLAHLQRHSGNCPEALNSYARAIQISEKMESVIGNYEARRGRLLCLISENKDSAVNDEMPILLKFFDDNRQKIAEESDRNIFFDNEQSVYDIATDYAYTNQKNAEQAFDYAENSRARSLLNLLDGSAEISQPLSLAEIRRQIPSDTQMIYYAVLPDKVLIWYISETKFTAVEKVIGQDELENKVSDYIKILRGKTGGENINGNAKEFYSLLIETVEPLLEKDKTLCIVADKQLFRLPFASLVSSVTSKYLVQDYPLLYAPSATVFIRETGIAKQKQTVENESILSIGNPSFSRQEYTELKNLPAAAKEAEEVASVYKTREVFIEEKASKESLINRFDSADVVHFAGHYLPNGKSPSHSKFLLASGDLTAEEISQRKLLRVRLMVLSACETGVEKFYNGEGMIGAARTFLTADVPLVVASLWSVETDATAELMIKFHFYRKQKKLPTVSALRQAQIDMLTGENSTLRQPFYWAGFLLIGGHATY